MTPASLSTLAQQVQALGMASATRLREAVGRRALTTAGQRAALRRCHLHSQLACGDALAISALHERLEQAGITPSITRSGVSALVETMRQSGWLCREMAADRSGMSVGTGRFARYRITDLGLAALAAMRENEPTPATTGDH